MIYHTCTSTYHALFDQVIDREVINPRLLHDLVLKFGSQSSVVVKRLQRNDKDVDLNPTTTRNETRTLGDAPSEGSPMVQTGSQWKTSNVKAELDM